MASMKLSHLEHFLFNVEVFKNPKVKLEQYATTPHIGSRMLYTIQSTYDDIEGKIVADLGCGCGSLAIGSCKLESDFCIGFDIDPDALDIFQQNCEYLEIANVDSVLCDVTNSIPDRFHNFFDCVVMNPPFGTKTKGIDIDFLKVALKLTDNAVYSLHKSSTRQYIVNKVKEWNVKAEVLAALRFDLPASYKFHKKSSVDIAVDFIRFSY